MAFTNADFLPSYEELAQEDINMTATPLRAAAHHLGKYCDRQCKEYMLCEKEEKDMRKCVYEGKAVTRCGIEFFQKVKLNCAEEFTKYWNCVDHTGMHISLEKCTKTQKIFDKCMKEQLGQDRPEIGYFAKVRVHKTDRPRPTRNPPMPDPLPDPPNVADEPIPESAKHRRKLPFF